MLNEFVRNKLNYWILFDEWTTCKISESWSIAVWFWLIMYRTLERFEGINQYHKETYRNLRTSQFGFKWNLFKALRGIFMFPTLLTIRFIQGKVILPLNPLTFKWKLRINFQDLSILNVKWAIFKDLWPGLMDSSIKYVTVDGLWDWKPRWTKIQIFMLRILWIKPLDLLGKNKAFKTCLWIFQKGIKPFCSFFQSLFWDNGKTLFSNIAHIKAK